ncbi:hypothetical protein C8J56DRAFT_929650 [Mycena floridula]|nr:hypothetical protein C8J56DRAFT_929650 [Mycena floridula]
MPTIVQRFLLSLQVLVLTLELEPEHLGKQNLQFKYDWHSFDTLLCGPQFPALKELQIVPTRRWRTIQRESVVRVWRGLLPECAQRGILNVLFGARPTPLVNVRPASVSLPA